MGFKKKKLLESVAILNNYEEDENEIRQKRKRLGVASESFRPVLILFQHKDMNS